MSETKPTISLDDQIATQQRLVELYDDDKDKNNYDLYRQRIETAILASLRELAAIKNQPVRCEICNGNDFDIPCAYTTEKPDGCLRAARLKNKPVLPEAGYDGPWLGCGECDSSFNCHDGKTACIRNPKQPVPVEPAYIKHLRALLGGSCADFYDIGSDNLKLILAHIDALQSALRVAQQERDDAQSFNDDQRQLCGFYQVSSKDELINAQAHHIEKLQSKLPPLKDEHPWNYRQG